MNKKSYSIKELATILGCSLTAVQKKIKVDNTNPEIKRYKNCYDVVIQDGKTVILLTDEELEKEKRLSKGFNNVNATNNATSENSINIETDTQKQTNQEVVLDKIFEFTNSYIERYTTLQKTYYNELQQKDKQVLLLTTSENKKEAEYLEAQAKAKELEKRNRLLNVYLIIATVIIVGFITVYLLHIR